MNKTILILLCVAVLFSLCACSRNKKDNNEENSGSSVSESSGHVETAEEKAEREYHQAIKAGMDNNELSHAADKVVCYYVDDQTYSRKELSDDLMAETAGDVRYILNITKANEFSGTYSGAGASVTGAYQVNYKMELFDRVQNKTVATKTLLGAEPSYLNTTDEDQYGDPPSDQAVGEWVSYAYQYRENDFKQEYQLGDFNYVLSVEYALDESESDTDSKRHETAETVLFVNYFSKTEYAYGSVNDFAKQYQYALKTEDAEDQLKEYFTVTYGDAVTKNGLLYFTRLEESTVSLTSDFRVMAFHETAKGFCVLEIAGHDKNAENEYVQLALEIVA